MLDDLLRRDVFVDLYAVVRNAVRVSQPRYSIKNLEVFLPIEREAEIKEGGTSILMFEEWMRTRDDANLQAIAAYNEEDCRSTLLLRDWLLGLKAEAIAAFGPIPAPPPIETKEEREEKVARAACGVAPRDGDPQPRSPESSSTTTTASASHRVGGFRAREATPASCRRPESIGPLQIVSS